MQRAQPQQVGHDTDGAAQPDAARREQHHAQRGAAERGVELHEGRAQHGVPWPQHAQHGRAERLGAWGCSLSCAWGCSLLCAWGCSLLCTWGCSLSHTGLQPVACVGLQPHTYLVELIVELEAAWLRADQPLHQVLQHAVRCGQPPRQQEQQAAPAVAATTTHTTTHTTHTTTIAPATTHATTIVAAAAQCARCVGPADEAQQGERGHSSQGEIDPPCAQLRG